jgi:hypothetical protein
MTQGVYGTDRDGRQALVHEYIGSDYWLGDVVDLFQLGRLDGDEDSPRLVLTMKEVHDLKRFADAYSFDYDEGFIEMCLDIHRFALAHPAEHIVLTADF